MSANLSGAIMNLPCKLGLEFMGRDNNEQHMYKRGHRDARHAAAELAVAQDALVDELLAALREISDDYADRFDLESPSTNPGIKACIQQARAAIAKAEAK